MLTWSRIFGNNRVSLANILQVLLCFLSQMDLIRSEDATKQVKQKSVVAKLEVQKVLVHYKKANIDTKHELKMAQDIQKFIDSYWNVRKSNNKISVEKFQKKLHQTMPFWKQRTLLIMKKEMHSQKKVSYKGLELLKMLSFLKA